MVLSSGKSDQEKGKPKQERGQTEVNRLKPGILDRLSGDSGKFSAELKPYLPSEIIGGSVPYVPGSEDEAVWNAAAQACGTEKVSYCYTVADGRCWYLAIPSSALASNPNSWCPLASALPGNEEYWDKETVYLYEQEGLASALRWDPDTGRMQIFVGPSRTILPRIQSMDANFVTINAKSLKPVRWRNRTLHTEKLSRLTAWFIVATGVFVTMLAFAYISYIHITGLVVEPELNEARLKTERATAEMMSQANKNIQNESLRHMARIQELLDVLAANEGTLLKYEVNGSNVTWSALIPKGISANDIKEIRGAKTLGLEEDSAGRSRVKIEGNR